VRVALLGGVPASIGGGGLELQLRRTHAALTRAGVEVFDVAAEPEPRPFDILHAFSAEPGVAHAIHHWRRGRTAPLVLSPVIVVPPGARELTLWLSHHPPRPTYAPRERALLLRRADAVIALTEHERSMVRRLGGRRVGRVEVIGNGVDPTSPVDAATLSVHRLPERYVVLLGSVSPRKRQADVLSAFVGSGVTPVVVGGLDGTAGDRARWERHVGATGGLWLGEITDPATVRAILGGAQALVHLSAAEGQSLAVLEALACGCPVLVSPLPSHHELARRHPRSVYLVDRLDRLPEALASIGQGPREPVAVDSWDDVAARLIDVYRDLLAER